MRYEHIELDISTVSCAELLEVLGEDLRCNPELANLQNELRARLQRRDVDPHCPLNEQKDWLEC